MRKNYCRCGCGKEIPTGQKYVDGHNRRGKRHSRTTKEMLRRKRISTLKQKEESLHPHRLRFPAKRRGEAKGDYIFRKFEYFCLHYISHVMGRFAGQPVHLMEWQRKTFQKLFSTLDEKGKRRYRRLYIHIPRKNGKTFLVCLLVLFWLAELSFDDLASECVSCASTRDQSIKTIFRTARLMVARSKELFQLIKIGLVPPHLTNRLTDGIYEPLSSDAPAQLGKNISLVIFDETHTQPNSDLWDAMTTSQSMREEPLFASISTSGNSRASFYFTVYEEMKKIQANPESDPSTLVVIYEAPEEMDWKSTEAFKIANPALGDKSEKGFRSEEEIEASLKQAQKGEGEGAYRQFYLNQWSQHGQRTLVRLDQWDRCRVDDFDIPDPKECRVVGGLDLSSTTDLTGLGIIIEPPTGSKIWVVITWAWLAGENLSECSRRDHLPYELWTGKEIIYFDGKPTIQIEAVLETLAKIRAKFPKFLKIGFDPYLGETLKPIEKYFELIPVSQQYAFLSPALKTLKGKILDKELHHGGDPLLRSCVENARVLSDPSANIRLDKSKSMSRIDPLVALNIAASIALREDFRR